LYKDIQSHDPCRDLAEGSVEAKEIKVQVGDVEEVFYYTIGPDKSVKIFKYDEAVGAYIPLKKSYPFYGDIARKILKFD
jgi:hypothetical protein